MTGKANRLVIAGLSAGLALTAAWLAAGAWGIVSGADGPSAWHITAPHRKQVPLDCRVEPLGEAELRAIQGRVYRNPLRDGLIRITVENTSGRDLGIYSWHPQEPFWVSIQIEDAAGRRVLFPHAAPVWRKRLGVINLDTRKPMAPIRTLKPGQSVTLRTGIWPPGGAADLRPGFYTVRVVCSYHRVPDGRECRVEAAPFVVTITRRDLWRWRWRDVLDIRPSSLFGGEEVAPPRTPASSGKPPK